MCPVCRILYKLYGIEGSLDRGQDLLVDPFLVEFFEASVAAALSAE